MDCSFLLTNTFLVNKSSHIDSPGIESAIFLFFAVFLERKKEIKANVLFLFRSFLSSFVFVVPLIMLLQLALVMARAGQEKDFSTDVDNLRKTN